MATPILEPKASLTFPGVLVEDDPLTLPITAATVSLDAGRVPYGMADLTVPLVSLDVLDDLDPRTPLRMVVSVWLAGQSPRTVDLHLRERTVDHAAGTITLRGATDESLLRDFTPDTVDATPRTYEGSIRELTNHVIGQVIPGAALQPGTDTDVTAYWPITNLLLNPSCEVSTANWSAAGNCTIFHATAPRTGTHACGVTSSAAGVLAVSPMNLAGKIGVSQGKSYVVSGFGRRFGATARDFVAVIRWVNAEGGTPWPDVIGNTVALTETGWMRSDVIGVAPVGAVAMFPFYRVTGTTAAGQIVYIDDGMAHEGVEPVAFFSGATVDDTHYTYDFTGAPHASTSTRTPTLERRPELFIWTPAVTAWDLLEPLCASVGRKLYCDEAREWWLIDPIAERRPGRVSVAAGRNATEGSDTLTRDTSAATLVVVRYRWQDADDIPREAFETAGEVGVSALYERDHAPTPGLAAQLLRSRQGQGRRQDVTALMHTGASPWQEVSITLPGTTDQLGRIVSVSWDLAAGLMTLGSTGLRDLPEGSIDALTGTIDALTGTINDL